jgi:hypothetical protein
MDEASIFFDLGTDGVATASIRVPAIGVRKQVSKGVSLSSASHGER